jgi:hypothetical protein
VDAGGVTVRVLSVVDPGGRPRAGPEAHQPGTRLQRRAGRSPCGRA